MRGAMSSWRLPVGRGFRIASQALVPGLAPPVPLSARISMRSACLLVPYITLAIMESRSFAFTAVKSQQATNAASPAAGTPENHRHPALKKQSCTPEPRAPTTTTAAAEAKTPPT